MAQGRSLMLHREPFPACPCRQLVLAMLCCTTQRWLACGHWVQSSELTSLLACHHAVPPLPISYFFGRVPDLAR